MINTHGDHVASCLCCQYCYHDSGSPDYSEWTPGWPASLKCTRGHWDFDDYGLMQKLHELGRECPDFGECPDFSARNDGRDTDT